jgi:N-acetylglucosamine-6-phosphate deacetylase
MRGFHHREPGIAGFGLLNKDVYVEIIGDLVHLHPKAVELILRLKDAGKVVLVSDSIRDTTISRKTRPMDKGTLSGGSLTIVDAGRRLIEAGFAEDDVVRSMTINPRAYLEGEG